MFLRVLSFLLRVLVDASSSCVPFRLASILQATIGGLAKDFGVVPLSDSVFHFSVSSRLVGFHVFKLWFFSCTLYKVYFHLWSNGGPRWIPEWRAFCVEEENAWIPAPSNKAKPASSFTRPNVSFADVVKLTPLTGANPVPLREQSLTKSVFDRLLFQTSKIQDKGKSPLASVIRHDPQLLTLV